LPCQGPIVFPRDRIQAGHAKPGSVGQLVVFPSFFARPLLILPRFRSAETEFAESAPKECKRLFAKPSHAISFPWGFAGKPFIVCGIVLEKRPIR